MEFDVFTAVKVLVPAVLTFAAGIAITPFLTAFLYNNQMWKKQGGKVDWDGKPTALFNQLHQERDTQVPKMGGILIWASVLAVIAVLWIAGHLFPTTFLGRLDFLSRSQTWIPLAVLLVGGLVGLLDDYMDIHGNGDHISGGLSLAKRLMVVATIGLLCGTWFFARLDVTSIGFPSVQHLELGWLIIPLFIIVTIAVYSGGVIDGLDGLAGGLFTTMFGAYGAIAFYQMQIDLAAFCATLAGGILAFLWFNIPPARFYMSETGSMALTVTLAVVAFMTDAVADGKGLLVLPIIALPLIATSASNIIQVSSKKFLGRKVFLIAPLHHHFEALGWPAHKVTMRFWIIGGICALVGIVIGILA